MLNVCGAQHRTVIQLIQLAILLLLALPVAALAQDYYVIQLEEASAEEVSIKLSQTQINSLRYYAETSNTGKSWRLKVGFFATEKDALAISSSFLGDYPKLKAQRIRVQEYNAVQDRIRVQAPKKGAGNALLIPLGNKRQIKKQMNYAATLYRQGDYVRAAAVYKLLAKISFQEHAAWAFELYGVCLEKQGRHAEAIDTYQNWLSQYSETTDKSRVEQRLAALETARSDPQLKRRQVSKRNNDNALYGSTSVFYRGLRRKIDGQDAETAISSVSADIDLHMRARSGDFLWRSRVNGGYVQDHSSRGQSNTRISNMFVSVTHKPSGAELAVGRQRRNDNGIYGYFDGVDFSFPITRHASLNLIAGSVSHSSRESSASDRRIFGIGSDLDFSNPGLRLHLYAVEQTFEGITERRALGGEFSYFTKSSHYLLVADYDVKFNAPNNLLFNASWDATSKTSIALSMGYQRSPFLSASNALIGEFDKDIEDLIDDLDDGDIYDAALDKTATSRYASIVINQQLSKRLRLVGELYRYELTDFPIYDPSFDSPDSDINTTAGIQFILDDAIFNNDILSSGLRYSKGDTADSVSIYVDEKLRFGRNLNLVLRMLASQRKIALNSQSAYTLRPSVRLNWYITTNLQLDMEMGVEWLSQESEPEDFSAQQAFGIIGLRKRF